MKTQLPVVGDRAGTFGRDASGEGCETGDPRLPGGWGELVDQRSLAYGAVATALRPDVEEARR
jgi:hypothetical protein